MKYSLVHPSRQRPIQALATLNNWVSKMSGDNTYEHMLSLDNSDRFAVEYLKIFPEISQVIQDDNTNCVQATNRAAVLATGDILIYLSDDFDAPQDWDTKLQMSIPKGQDHYALWVNDGITANKPIMTIPIISAALYKDLGYLYSPRYKSMFVDEDLYWVCGLRRVIVNCKHLLFEHNHYTKTGKGKDETYQAHDNPQRYREGQQIFLDRKARNFRDQTGAIR